VRHRGYTSDKKNHCPQSPYIIGRSAIYTFINIQYDDKCCEKSDKASLGMGDRD
jgi:hypothetical protein